MHLAGDFCINGINLLLSTFPELRTNDFRMVSIEKSSLVSCRVNPKVFALTVLDGENSKTYIKLQSSPCIRKAFHKVFFFGEGV